MQLTDGQKEEKECALEYEVSAVMSAVMKSVDTWLSESETPYLVTSRVSVADLAVFQQLKQVCSFGGLTIDENEYSKLAAWYAALDTRWNSG